MSTTPPVTPETPASASASTKVLGVERRLIGFGFGLLLVLVVLAVIYSQFTRQPMPTSVDTDVPQAARSEQMKSAGTPAAPAAGTAVPATLDSLVESTLAEDSDLSQYENDEMADVEDGSNN